MSFLRGPETKFQAPSFFSGTDFLIPSISEGIREAVAVGLLLA